MSKRLVVGAVLIGLLALWMGAALGAEAVTKAGVVKGNNEFALGLYGKLRGEKGNLFFSPYSISTALAMTYAGARDNTAAEMKAVLRLPGGPDDKTLHDAFGALVGDLNAAGKRGKFKLSVANALWAQQDYKFLATFTGLVAKNYDAGLTPLDFARQTEASRKTINKWVEDKTQDKIKELLKKGIVTPDTRLVLTNAIYFKGDWRYQFDKKRTKDAPFWVSVPAGKTVAERPVKVEVPMMYRKGNFEYANLETSQLLQLPYKGGELSMVILLPSPHVGMLRKLEESLTTANLAKWLGAARKREVHVHLPRFKMTSEFSLAGTLSAMGMKDAFAPGKANFSGMDGTYDLFISAVVHKAFVDVNEEGTEAAAATGVVVGVTSAPMHPSPVFRADRPFVFLIRENKTGSILFMGRVTNPKK